MRGDIEKNPLSDGEVISIDGKVSSYIGFEAPDIKPLLSRGDLLAILSCPSKWKKGYAEPDKPNRSTEFGSLLDCLLLQPQHLESYYKLTPATYTNSSGEEKPWLGLCRKLVRKHRFF